jgi:hypothetical protein
VLYRLIALLLRRQRIVLASPTDLGSVERGRRLRRNCHHHVAEEQPHAVPLAPLLLLALAGRHHSVYVLHL